MNASIIPFPTARSITDALGSTIEVSHYEVCQSPRIVVEIAEGEIVNAHLTITQAERLREMLTAEIAAARRDHMTALGIAMQHAQQAIS
jgi:hypothetical protein